MKFKNHYLIKTCFILGTGIFGVILTIFIFIFYFPIINEIGIYFIPIMNEIGIYFTLFFFILYLTLILISPIYFKRSQDNNHLAELEKKIWKKPTKISFYIPLAHIFTLSGGGIGATFLIPYFVLFLVPIIVISILTLILETYEYFTWE